ncbi:uncharacterized protein Z518_10717 [Rhinocladiella mackenziei CBS 650.93]|uniref:Methyltransferase domain-containing protein n=1 Tax=Rhinocladiella mackenziei CBS 650.93 TaxID=1442369 RepID=A0A0D2ISN9_9EURO|nr:uncharacterized protein Z518_10717 [Rhinocladiella mackenziei CBS 650.93]KIW99789.1 hypothetical protein Z518_10717 [Rhinocladiella mackenziei CBS 650.93]
MSLSASETAPFYPSTRNIPESARLKAQSDLITDVAGGLILCPIDLAASSLRILDSGTGDGQFLAQLRSRLAHPDSATVVGTDVASSESGLPSFVEWHKQNINTEWPSEWQGTFDLVHQRNVLFVAGGFDRAVKAATRLAKLVKPGGWIQIVEGHMPNAPISESDRPHIKMTEISGQFLNLGGFDTAPSTRLPELLKESDELQSIRGLELSTRIGMGAKDELREARRIWLKAFGNGLGNGLAQIGDKAPMGQAEFYDLMDQVEWEAEI